MRFKSASNRERSKCCLRDQGSCQPTSGTLVFSRVASTAGRRLTSMALTPMKFSERTVMDPSSLQPEAPQRAMSTTNGRKRRMWKHRRAESASLLAQVDDEGGAAIEAAGLLARVVVFGPLLAVADGAEAVGGNAAAHQVVADRGGAAVAERE